MRATSARGGALHRNFVMFTVFLLVVAVMPLAPPQASAATTSEYWVDAVNGSDGDPGTQVAPFKTLTHAVSVAGSSDTIWVEPGLYDVATNGETFPLDLFGETIRSTQGPDVTILDGGGVDRIMDGEWFTDGDMIEGLTFQNGADPLPGGAMRMALNNGDQPDALIIANNVFSSNETTEQSGGAISVYAIGATKYVRITGNEFYDNHADVYGGAITVYMSHLNATIEDNLFDHNSAEMGGGAIHSAATDETQTITGNTFVDNLAEYGGAIFMGLTSGPVHSITDNTFSGNDAAQDGGAIWLYNSNFVVSGNDAGGNGAFSGGGFGFAQQAEVFSENNVIGGCFSGDVGAAWAVTAAALAMQNDTVADCYGCDTLVWAESDTDWISVDNSVLWSESVDHAVVNVDRLEYSCVSDMSATGTGVIYDDPMFVDLAAHDARLRVGSPCIDTGDATHAATVDFYGSPRPLDGDNDGNAIVDMGYFERPVPAVGRLSGADRYATAAALVEENFDSAHTCIIASGKAFPDALSAAGLAGSYDAPLLLTDPNSVPAVIAQTLSDLGVSDVIIIGGTGAVSEAVETELAASYMVARLGGINRYDTSAMVADEIARHEGDAFSGVAFFARGDAFPDALAVSPFAYGIASPILLTRPTGLPTETQTAIDDLDIVDGFICGGTAAVSSSVKTQIDQLIEANGGGLSATERWGGVNRYDTARIVAEGGLTRGLGTFDYVGVATGLNYPDALAGGVTTGVNGGVVLLTAPTSLPTATTEAFSDHGNEVMYVDIFGGTAAVSSAVRTSIEGILGW